MQKFRILTVLAGGILASSGVAFLAVSRAQDQNPAPVAEVEPAAADQPRPDLLAQADANQPATPAAPAAPETPAPTPAPADAAPAAPPADGGARPPGMGGPGGGFGRRGGFGGPGGGFGGPPANADGAGGATVTGDSVNLQFPLNAINDILPVYERLTGKTVIKDSSVFSGPQISLVTQNDVPKDEAIRLIEAALIINGYVVVHDSDGKTIRLQLSRAANQLQTSFNDGEVLYTAPENMPAGEALISYFMKLDFMAPEDAAVIFSNHVQLNPYGRLTAVTTPSGLLITESAAIIRKFVKLKDVIDVPPNEARLMTEFVQLEYADANTVAQIVQAAMDARLEESQRINELGRTVRGEQAQTPQQGGNNNQGNSNNQSRPATTSGGTINIRTTITNPQDGVIGSATDPSAQLIADDRLNRIMVQASPTDIAFILNLIQRFDQPLRNQVPLERHLNYVKSADVLPTVVDILMDMGSGTTQLPGGRSIDTRNTPVSSSQLTALTGAQQTAEQQNRFIQQQGGGTTGTTTTGTVTTNTNSQADRLSYPIDETAPISVLVGKTRIIADRQANVIIVMGSEEAQKQVSEILDRLDRKQPQVYLAMVIGQLTLGNGMEFGVDYLKQYESFQPGNLNASGAAAGLIAGRPDLTDAIADVRDNLITNAIGPAAGLNIYGQIGDHFDVFITALETSNRFKVLSRPVLSVQNNKRASITNGQKIPYPATSLTDATGGVANAALSTTVEYQDVVLKLEIIPMINSDNEVTLDIAQVNDTLAGTQLVGVNEVPVINTEVLTTTVTVPDRHTLVLGGLITEQDTKETSGIPVVSRIPVVGNAFKNTDRSVTRAELLIFIQPVVVDGKASHISASYDEDLRTEVGADAAKAFPAPGVPTKEREQEDFERSEDPQPLIPQPREKNRGKMIFPWKR